MMTSPSNNETIVHTEFLVEYNLETNMVYVSGLTPEGFWEEIQIYDDVDDVRSFSEGLVEGFKTNKIFAQAQEFQYS